MPAAQLNRPSASKPEIHAPESLNGRWLVRADPHNQGLSEEWWRELTGERALEKSIPGIESQADVEMADGVVAEAPLCKILPCGRAAVLISQQVFKEPTGSGHGIQHGLSLGGPGV